MHPQTICLATLPTGIIPRTTPPAVGEKIARLLEPWVPEALASGRAVALPFPAAGGVKARLAETPDGLIARLTLAAQGSANARRAAPPLLATVGVAPDLARARALWRLLARRTGTLGPPPPAAPCCLIIPDRELALRQPEMGEWLADFATGLGQAWLRQADREPPPGALAGALMHGDAPADAAPADAVGSPPARLRAPAGKPLENRAGANIFRLSRAANARFPSSVGRLHGAGGRYRQHAFS